DGLLVDVYKRESLWPLEPCNDQKPIARREEEQGSVSGSWSSVALQFLSHFSDI
uniref:Uncharacterized protein n=1 Tax=Aegilops tauschii subsp. strangulata TaxID=200361 RepID=A0A453LW38_AEGTS